MKKTDLAYTAGIIDGEGCIRISKRYRNKRYEYNLQVVVESTSEWLVKMLKFTYGGSISFQKARDINRQATWRWTIVCQQAAEFLKLILPYLRLKSPQAEIAIRFQGGGVKSALPLLSALDEAEFIALKMLKRQYKQTGEERGCSQQVD